MSDRRRLFGAACGGMAVFGIVLSLLGVLFGLPEMQERLGVSLAEQGNIFLVLFFGVFLSTVLSGPVIDSFGNKIVLTFSGALISLALVLFAAADSYPAALGAAFVLGFGGGGLNTSANALVADLYIEDRGAMLNVVGTFFGVGALVLPLAAAGIAGVFSVSRLLQGAAALAAALTVVVIVLKFPVPEKRTSFSLLASVRAVSYPGVLLFAAILFCQSGIESSVGGWTSTYAGSMGAPPRAATFILAAFWASLMTGRLIAAVLLKRMTKPQLVLASGIGSIAGCAILYGSRSIAVVAAGAVISGLSFAAIYPTVLAIAADRYERLAGTIFGFLFATGLIGGMLFPWAIGQVSELSGIRAGMILPFLGATTVTLLALIMSRSAHSLQEPGNLSPRD